MTYRGKGYDLFRSVFYLYDASGDHAFVTASRHSTDCDGWCHFRHPSNLARPVTLRRELTYGPPRPLGWSSSNSRAPQSPASAPKPVDDEHVGGWPAGRRSRTYTRPANPTWVPVRQSVRGSAWKD